LSRVLITGSSDGLGLMAGQLLAADGHSVTLHARNQGRADDTRAALPRADGVVVGDLSTIAGMRQVAAQANAVEPGWVPTKMGGPGAPDDLSLAPVTQAWLAVSTDLAATVTGGYFYHQQPRATHPAARDVKVAGELLRYCAELTGVELPR
jgi:NAD(P)-dependent dehydrogenase (short-subunit alcohol dehydrogenase family)